GFRRRWYRTPTFVAGVSVLGAIVLLALLAPVATWHSATEQDLLHILQGPSWSHPFGTDELGRDVWSRLVYGARTDLQVAFLAVLFPFTLGTALGQAHHPPAPAPERGHPGDRLLDVRRRPRHPRDRHPRLPRPRRPASDAGLGEDDRGRTDLPDDALGAVHDPRDRRRDHRA